MLLRRIAEGDIETVRQLRNANRRFFFHDAEVSPAQQATWFHGLASKPLDFYVIEADGEVVGTISATRSDHGIEIGNLVLADAARGRGLMRRAVEQLTAAPGEYFAEIKSANAPSIAVFEACGFSIIPGAGVVRAVKHV